MAEQYTIFIYISFVILGFFDSLCEKHTLRESRERERVIPSSFSVWKSASLFWFIILEYFGLERGKGTSCIIENRIEMTPLKFRGNSLLGEDEYSFFFLSLPFGRKRRGRWGRKKGIVFAGLAKSIKLISKVLGHALLRHLPSTAFLCMFPAVKN